MTLLTKVSCSEQENILSQINEWLNTIYPYKRIPAYICDVDKSDVDNFRIMTQGKRKFDIYVRFGNTWISSSSKTIVIARIGFEKQRCGHGTRFLKLILNVAMMYGYDHIGIEMTNFNSKLFAEKYGFKPHYSNEGNYVISTEELKLTLP